MVVRPLSSLGLSKDRALVREVMRQICGHLLCPEPSEQVRLLLLLLPLLILLQVRLFILPSLAASKQLRLEGLVDSLVQEVQGVVLPRTPCLLYSFLLLSQEGLASLGQGQEENYLEVALVSFSYFTPACLSGPV